MNNDDICNKYGFPQAKNRPTIKAEKRLILNGEEGSQIIKSETKLTLNNHKKTFERMADM